MIIIDLDIGTHQRTMKHTFSIPNLIKEYSLSDNYTSRMHHSIGEECDFTAGINSYVLMTEQEAQTKLNVSMNCGKLKVINVMIFQSEGLISKSYTSYLKEAETSN